MHDIDDLVLVADSCGAGHGAFFGGVAGLMVQGTRYKVHVHFISKL